MAYVVECLDCEAGNVELGSTKRVNQWIFEHQNEEGSEKHTVSVYNENGVCLADVDYGQQFDGENASPDFDSRDSEGYDDELPPGRLFATGEGETSYGSLYSLAR